MSSPPPPRATAEPARLGATDIAADAREPIVMLAVATAGFLINFWAWSLLSPLAGQLRDELQLTSLQQSLLVAVPVLVGSLGRIPVGALTDRFGARAMFPAVSLLTSLPVLFVGLVGDSFGLVLLGGFFLGLGGTAFAIGVPFVNAWFPPAKRGLAIGIFGVGTAGTALSAFTTVQLADTYGRAFPFLVVAILLVVYAFASRLLLRNPPVPRPGVGGLLQRTWATLRMRTTLQLSALYAVGFGGFVAFSVYLPTYLRNAYDLAAADAANRTAGFVLLAVIARPIGGWLSDRLHPVPVLTVCFAATAGLAGLAALEPPLLPWATFAFLGLATALGASAGACFALLARVAPAEAIGGVTGIVGAAGGLGGFLPPLLMGAIYGRSGDYTTGYLLLVAVAATAALYTAHVIRAAHGRGGRAGAGTAR